MRLGKYKWILANIIAVCGFLFISIGDILLNFNADSISKIGLSVLNEAETIVDSIKLQPFTEILIDLLKITGDFSTYSLIEILLGEEFIENIEYLMHQSEVVASAVPEFIKFFCFVIFIGFALTVVLGVLAFFPFVKSIANLNKNPEKSVYNSKKSIKSAAIIYFGQTLCVLIFNAYSQVLMPEPLNYIKLSFPIITFIFLLVCIAMLYLPQLVGAAAAKNTSAVQLNSSVSNVADWYCTKCGNGNCSDCMFCVYCGEAKSTCSVDDNEAQKEASDNTDPTASAANDAEQIWYCSACGKDNGVSYLYCVNCGVAKENNSQGVTQLAMNAVDKVKNIASNIPKPAIDAKGAVDKIKNVASNISLPTSNSKNDFEKIKQLKELLDMGAITQEEFDKKKAEILKL